MALRIPTLAATLAVLAAASGCGDDGGGPIDDSRLQRKPAKTSNASCRGVRGHPVNVAADPPGDVVACSARDGSSLRLQNVSAYVLRVRPIDLYDRTSMTLDRRSEPPGLDAAHSTSGSGFDTRRESFVVPLGRAMTATSDSTVSLAAQADVALTARANVARYLAAWVASNTDLRGEDLARPVRTCARSAPGLVHEGAYVEDALRGALEHPPCQALVDDVARARGADPARERLRARRQIFRAARRVLRVRLTAHTTRVLARR